MDEDSARLRAKGVDARGLACVGGHEWSEEFCATAGEFLAGRLGG